MFIIASTTQIFFDSNRTEKSPYDDQEHKHKHRELKKKCVQNKKCSFKSITHLTGARLYQKMCERSKPNEKYFLLLICHSHTCIMHAVSVLHIYKYRPYRHTHIYYIYMFTSTGRWKWASKNICIHTTCLYHRVWPKFLLTPKPRTLNFGLR